MPQPAKPDALRVSLEPNAETDDAPDTESSPINLHGVDITSMDGGVGLTSLPPLPGSPTSPRHSRDTKGFFGHLKGSKSQHRIPAEQPGRLVRGVSEGEEDSSGAGSMSRIYHLKKNPGSTPELSLVGSTESFDRDPADGKFQYKISLCHLFRQQCLAATRLSLVRCKDVCRARLREARDVYGSCFHGSRMKAEPCSKASYMVGHPIILSQLRKGPAGGPRGAYGSRCRN